MPRLLISLLLIFALMLVPVGGSYPEAKAVAPAAPLLAIGALEALAIAATGAALLGVITASQNKAYQDQISDLIESIKEASAAALRAVLDKSLSLISKMSTHVGLQNCGSILLATAAISAYVRTVSRVPSRTRSTAEGECDPKLRESPFTCCPQFMKQIQENANVEQLSAGAFRVSFFARHGIRKQCCMEWDSLHGRFEMFSKSNHTGTRHDGERACARESDLEKDSCFANMPDKADYTGRHSPRQGCQQ